MQKGCKKEGGEHIAAIAEVEGEGDLEWVAKKFCGRMRKEVERGWNGLGESSRIGASEGEKEVGCFGRESESGAARRNPKRSEMREVFCLFMGE
jgi:hypothetical protein